MVQAERIAFDEALLENRTRQVGILLAVVLIFVARISKTENSLCEAKVSDVGMNAG